MLSDFQSGDRIIYTVSHKREVQGTVLSVGPKGWVRIVTDNYRWPRVVKPTSIRKV